MVDILKDYSPDRSNTKAMKWHDLETVFGDKDLLPIWIADMDFAPAKEVTAAIQSFVDDQYFGYYSVPDSYYQSLIGQMTISNIKQRLNGTGLHQVYVRVLPLPYMRIPMKGTTF